MLGVVAVAVGAASFVGGGVVVSRSDSDTRPYTSSGSDGVTVSIIGFRNVDTHVVGVVVTVGAIGDPVVTLRVVHASLTNGNTTGSSKRGTDRSRGRTIPFVQTIEVGNAGYINAKVVSIVRIRVNVGANSGSECNVADLSEGPGSSHIDTVSTCDSCTSSVSTSLSRSSDESAGLSVNCRMELVMWCMHLKTYQGQARKQRQPTSVRKINILKLYLDRFLLKTNGRANALRTSCASFRCMNSISTQSIYGRNCLPFKDSKEMSTMPQVRNGNKTE